MASASGDGGCVNVEPLDDTRTEVRSYFVRQRNALAVRADFQSLYVDYYLHLMEQRLRPPELLDSLLKDALAAITLTLASRPWDEVTSWTVNFQEPLFNLFVTGSSQGENVVGRLFTEDVKKGASNLFISQVVERDGPQRRSIIEFEGVDFLSVVEAFYTQSEQRRCRFFRYSEEDLVMITAQPDCDRDWLESLRTEDIKRLDEEELSLLETRYYRFSCGCTVERILPSLAALSDALVDQLFEGDPFVTVQCPRCGVSHQVTRVALEEHRR